MNVIKSSAQISDVFQTGTRFGAKGLTILIKEHDATRRDLPGRVAFIAGKKLGNAVTRNRCKRVLRAVARESSVAEVQGYDVVLIANRRTCDVAHAELVRSLDDLVKKAGMR